MGMAASQARLLSITARLTNNENTGQAVSYSKQRLADQTQQITNEYNEALDATKLTVLTGFNGAEACYEDISYNLMTGPQMAQTTKQYVVTDTKGRVLVTEAIADAYSSSKGNYNQFLAKMGYSQADITVQKPNDDKDTDGLTTTQQKIHEAWDKYFATVGINKFMPEHDFGFSFTETYAYGTNNDPEYNIGDGYVGYEMAQVEYDENDKIARNEDGSIKYVEVPILQIMLDSNGNVIKDGENICYEKMPVDDIVASEDFQRYPDNYIVYRDDDGNITDIYQYAHTGDTKYTQSENTTYKDAAGDDQYAYIIDSENGTYKTYETQNLYSPINYEGTTQESRDLYDYAMAITEAYLRTGKGTNGESFKTEYDMESIKSASDSENNNMLKYYKNLFYKMQASGFFTYTDTPAKAKDSNYIYSESTTGTGKVAKNPLKDNYTFEAGLRDGSLRLEYYSTTEKAFKSTTISEDNCIQEVADERAIAKAESKYNQDMADLENKDKKLDLELKKLDTEHNALQTEYESVKSVVDKNVESTFKIFS